MAKQDSTGNYQPAYMPIQARILRLYDDMAEFQDQCSFLYVTLSRPLPRMKR